MCLNTNYCIIALACWLAGFSQPLVCPSLIGESAVTRLTALFRVQFRGNEPGLKVGQNPLDPLSKGGERGAPGSKVDGATASLRMNGLNVGM